MPRGRNAGAAVVLFFLAPVIAELLSSSAPPVEFFNPFGFPVMCLLYGCGALLARELCVRWKKGWLGLLALGAAFAIIEEGLMVRSFFDPSWPDLGILASHGRALGVNWVWSLNLIIFHSVYSIVVPNILVGLLFPSSRGEPWMGRAAFIVVCALFWIDVIVGGLMVTKYSPPLVPFLVAIALAGGLVMLARFLPEARLLPVGSGRNRGAVLFFLAGLLGAVGHIVSTWILPRTGMPALATAALTAAEAAGALLVVRLLTRVLTLSEINQWSLATGILAIFIAVSPFLSKDSSRTDDARGMGFVGLGMVIFLGLVLVGVLVRRKRGLSSPAAGGTSSPEYPSGDPRGSS